MKEMGIYMIQSISKPERVYIGSSIRLSGRLWGHFNELKNNKHHSTKLQRHFNKYGKEDLEFSVLESGEYIDKTHLLAREQGWYIPYGYMNKNELPYFNECGIAGSIAGTHLSKKTRKKIGTTKIGNTYALGKKHSEEANQRMRKPKSEEHRKHISEARKDMKFSAEHCKHLSESHQTPRPWMIGNKQSEERNKKVSESLLEYHKQKKLAQC